MTLHSRRIRKGLKIMTIQEKILVRGSTAGRVRPEFDGAPPTRRRLAQIAARTRAALLRRAHMFADGMRDRLTGADGTHGKHELSELTIDSPHVAAGVHFVSTPRAVLDWVQACLPPDPEKPAWTFLDLGCGKGRAVLSAAARPYGRIVGIEFARELAAEAHANVAAAGHAASRVSILQDDAATATLPGGPLIVFLFNPFGPAVLAPLLQRLGQAAAGGQPILVAYVNPVHAALFECDPAFETRTLPRGTAWKLSLASPYRLALYAAGPARRQTIR